MKPSIKLTAKRLRFICKIASSVVASRLREPLLECVYFVGDSLHVSNRDSLLTAKLAPGETNGGDVNFAVSLSRLQAIAGACLPDEAVTLQESANAKTVAVTSERGKWLLQKVASDGFPFLKFDGSPLFRIPCDQFCRAIKPVLPAKDDSGTALTGLHCDVVDGVVTLVCTDGRRLYCHELEVDQAVDDRSVTIPAKAVATAASFAAASEGAIQVEVAANGVILETDEFKLTAVLLDGEFPKWREAVPASVPTRHAAIVADMLTAVRLASVVTSETSRGVKMVFGDGKLTISAKSPECGASRVDCDLVESAEPSEIVIDPRHVSDWLTGLDSSEVVHASIADTGRLLLEGEDNKAVMAGLVQDG